MTKIVAPLDSPPTKVTHEIAVQTWNKIGGIFLDGGQAAPPPVDASTLFFPEKNFLMYAGHGKPKELIGQLQLYRLLGPVYNMSSTVSPRIFYAVACLSGQKLGRYLVEEQGVKAYLGFDDYTFVAFDEPEHNFKKDFINLYLTVVNKLWEGHTIGEAAHAFKAKCEDLITLYDQHPEWKHPKYQKALKTMKKILILRGNPTVTL